MKPKTLLLRMVILLITLMSALGANAQEAYACYTFLNSTLTFYYDFQRNSRSGKIYDINTDNNDPGWYTDNTFSKVTKVVFDPSFAGAKPTTTRYWFQYMRGLETIEGMNYLNTSEVTNMGWMFYSCSKLTDLDLRHFNTAKVTNMARMFSNCSILTSLDLSSFNTSKVTGMNFMFSDCTNLRTIYVGDGWSTAAVEYGTSMFTDCTSLVGCIGTTYNANHVDKEYAHIDGGLSNPGYFWPPREAYACYTSSNTTLTFYYDGLRNSRPGRSYNLNTSTVEPGWYKDGTNANVTKVVFDSSFALVRPTTTFDWFYGMTNLESFEGMRYLNTSEVENMNWMFADCSKLTSLDLSHFDTSKVDFMARMFSGCSSLTTLDLASFNTLLVDEMGNMFFKCSELQTIHVGSGWKVDGVIKSDGMFYRCNKLVGSRGTTWSSSNPTDKTYAHIDGGAGNPGYFTEPRETYACYTPENTTLTFYFDNLRISHSNTYDLNELNSLPDWLGISTNVTKVVFDPSFADARPTITDAWFINMENLESIEGMSYLNTSEVIDMSFMFNLCSSLKSLDLSSFNTSQVNEMEYMFSDCTNLQTIYVGDGWSTSSVTDSSDMFKDCNKLVGGKGTTYDANYIDATYAHLDGGKSNPGYFTERPAGITTGIENGQRESVKGQRDGWFTIDGQKLSGKPTKKGVYIYNGRAVVL